MRKVTLATGTSYDAGVGVSILEAAEAAGLHLPHSCRSGRCSSCKCKIVGETEVLLAETGLNEAEKAEGWVLACVRTALEDVAVDIHEIDGTRFSKPRMVPAKIDALEMLSVDVMRVRLRLPPGTRFDYVAGQNVEVVGKGGLRRSYSLARRADGGLLELHIRRVEGGAMSAYWFGEAKVNDLLRIHGPLGTFCLRHGPKTTVVFLATGTGIAPVIAMLEELAAQPEAERPAKVAVYWGGRCTRDLYCDPASHFDAAVVVTTISRAEEAWGGARGYVQDHALAAIAELGDPSNVQVYACGSYAMIRSARVAMEAAGVPESGFYSDAFVASNT